MQEIQLQTSERPLLFTLSLLADKWTGMFFCRHKGQVREREKLWAGWKCSWKDSKVRGHEVEILNDKHEPPMWITEHGTFQTKGKTGVCSQEPKHLRELMDSFLIRAEQAMLRLEKEPGARVPWWGHLFWVQPEEVMGGEAMPLECGIMLWRLGGTKIPKYRTAYLVLFPLCRHMCVHTHMHMCSVWVWVFSKQTGETYSKMLSLFQWCSCFSSWLPWVLWGFYEFVLL